MKITTAGIDVAKTLFQVHGVDEHGTPVDRRSDSAELMAEARHKNVVVVALANKLARKTRHGERSTLTLLFNVLIWCWARRLGLRPYIRI
jgi:hypothetical protein